MLLCLETVRCGRSVWRVFVIRLVDGECTQWPTSSSAGLSRRRPVLAHKTHFDCASRTDTIVWAVTP